MTEYANTKSRRAQIVHIDWTRELIDDTDSSPLDWMDAERIAAWRNSDFTMIGIRARADIMIPIGQGSFRLMTLRSAGLWSIESDSGEDYLESIFEDEKAQLLAELKTLCAGL